MTLTIICSSRESIATMLSKYVLRERKGSVRGRQAKPDSPWMDASEARELSLLTRRFSAARGCDVAAVNKVRAIWLHLHRRRASTGSYFETSSRKSLSSVCLARPLHTCKDQEERKTNKKKNRSRPPPSHDLCHNREDAGEHATVTI